MALLFIMISHCFKVRVSNQLAFRVRRAVTWLRKQPTFRNASSGFPAKWRLRNEHSAEIPYWWRVTTQIWVVLLIASERALMSSYTDTRLIRTPHYYGQFVLSPPPPRGYSLIQAIGVCSTPKGMVFAPFWSENGLRLCPFWSGIGIVFKETTGLYESIYRFNAKWIRKKEKYANSKWILRNLSCWPSNLSNDDIIS